MWLMHGTDAVLLDELDNAQESLLDVILKKRCRHEISDELLLRVRASVDLRQRAELCIRTEDEIDSCSWSALSRAVRAD